MDTMSISPKTVETYKENLQNNLTLYVKYDRMTLEKAGEVLSSIMENIFGNEQHGGIVHFIIANNPGIQEEEAIQRAEKYYENGWRVRKEGSKYILLDQYFSSVSDMSDKSSMIPKEAVNLEFTEEETCNMLKDSDAKALGAIAAKKGIPPKDMVSPTKAYQLIDRYYGSDHSIYPVVQSYYALGKVLRKVFYFSGKGLNNTLKGLHEKGYRIDPSVNPTTLPVAYLSGGGSPIVVRPVTNFVDTEEEYYNELEVYIPIYKTLGIDCEQPQVLSDMGQIYGFYFDRNNNVDELGEILRIISNSAGAKNNRLVERISAILLIENLVRLHNSGLEAININTAKLTPSLKYHPREKIRNPELIDAAISSGKSTNNLMEALKGITDHEASEEFQEAVGYFAANAPATLVSALKNINSPEAKQLIERLSQ